MLMTVVDADVGAFDATTCKKIKQRNSFILRRLRRTTDSLTIIAGDFGVTYETVRQIGIKAGVPTDQRSRRIAFGARRAREVR
jgi:hypothetical protein